MRALGILPALAVALAVATAQPAFAQAPENTTWTEAYIETPGEPTLHVDILRPKGLPESAKTPVILNIGPYNGHGGATLPYDRPGGGPAGGTYTELFSEGGAIDRGYTVLLADLRGFGGSQGCNDFGGPGEQLDTKRAVEWAASQPWSTGKVGLWGKSYDAWTQVMALDEKPKGLAAAVIQAPLIDGYHGLFMNGVHYDAGWYATVALYQEIDALPPHPTDKPEYFLNWAQGTRPDCYAANIALATAMSDPASDFWKERELPGAVGTDVPVLWSHGFLDANTKPDNFMPVWAALTGPSRAWFGQYAHDRASKTDHIVGRDGFREESLRWLDRYVKGDPAALVENDPRTVIQDSEGRWRAEPQWPPADAVVRAMPLNKGEVFDEPNNDAEGKTTGNTGVGIWSFTSPLPHDARFAGPPRVSLSVATTPQRAHIYALLYDVAPGGKAKLVTRGAHVVQPGDSTVVFDLYPQDWFLGAGHRLGVLVAGSDLDWFNPPHSGQSVNVSTGELHVPYLRYRRDVFLEGDLANAQNALRPIDVSDETVQAGTVQAELPPAMTPMPASGPGAGNRPAAKPKRARLSVRARARGRAITVTVRGVTRRVRIQLAGPRKRFARTIRPRRGLATVRFRNLRRGTYRITASVGIRSATRRIRIR